MLNFSAEMNSFELSPEEIQRSFAITELNETQKSLIISSIRTIFDSVFGSYQKNLPFVFYALKEINDISKDDGSGADKFNQIFSDEFEKGIGRCANYVRLKQNLIRIFDYKFKYIEYFDKELKILKLNESVSAKKEVAQEIEIQNLMSFCVNEVVKQLPQKNVFKEQCNDYGLTIVEGKNERIELHGKISVKPSKGKKFAEEKGIVSPVLREREISRERKLDVIPSEKRSEGIRRRIPKKRVKKRTTNYGRQNLNTSGKKRKLISSRRKTKAPLDMGNKNRNSLSNQRTKDKKNTGKKRRLTNLQKKARNFIEENKNFISQRVKNNKHKRTSTGKFTSLVLKNRTHRRTNTI